MSNLILINKDTKINLDLVRSFRHHKETSSVYIVFNNGDEEKYFVSKNFDFRSISNVPNINTIPAELNRYILVCNVDIRNCADDSPGWMEHHQVIGWERVYQRTIPITTQYNQQDFFNKSEYLIDLKEQFVINQFDQGNFSRINLSDLDAVGTKKQINDDHVEYIKEVLLGQTAFVP